MRRSSRLAHKANDEHEAPPSLLSASEEQSPSSLHQPLAPHPPPQPAAKASLDGDALMLIIKSIPNEMDRWQAATALALAGGFGSGYKEFLAAFWLGEARQLVTNFTRPPFKTMASKKEAAKIAEIPVESLPLTVPPVIVGKARRHLLRRQVEREIAELEETEDLDALITLTSAMSEYHLNKQDIAHLPYDTRRNPHYRSAAPMCLYTLRDIIRQAYLKHGGAEGLEIAHQKSEQRKSKLQETKRAKEEQKKVIRQQREAELSAALAARGLALRGDSTLCDQYIEGTSTKSLETVVNVMHEMSFYFNHTDYEYYHDDEWEEWRRQVGGRPDSQDKRDISENAKSRALSDLQGRIGIQGVLAIPDLPPTIRMQLQRRGN